MLNMFRTLIHLSSEACDFSIVSPHWLCLLVSMCVGVLVWLGWGGIRVAGWFYAQHVSDINTSIIRSLRLFYCITTLVVFSCFDVCWSFGVVGLGWYPCSRLIMCSTCFGHYYIHTIIYTNAKNLHLYRTHDQCGYTIEKSQASDDGCINVRNMLSIEEVK